MKSTNNTKKIQVTLEAFYGVCCGGGGSMCSEATHEIAVSQGVYNTLLKFGETEIDCEEIEEAIDAGTRNLKRLHKHLCDLFYEMVTHYWLYESYNDCWTESLSKYILDDIKNGLYVEEKEEDCFFDEDEEAGYIDIRRLIAYKDWLLDGTHDNDFIAERMEADIEGIRDDYEVQYTIKLACES